jgi:hypothetical protein
MGSSVVAGCSAPYLARVARPPLKLNRSAWAAAGPLPKTAPTSAGKYVSDFPFSPSAFPFLELSETSVEPSICAQTQFCEFFFSSRNRSFPHLRNRSGTDLASRMHKEKIASESNQDDLAANNLTIDHSITYGKYNNTLPVRGPVNEKS